MSNGQTQTPQGQPDQTFFTAGEGSTPPDQNPHSDNLNIESIRNDTEQRDADGSLGRTALNPTDPKSVGAEVSETTSTPETNQTTPDELPGFMKLPEDDPTAKLGTVFDLETKPPIEQSDAPQDGLAPNDQTTEDKANKSEHKYDYLKDHKLNGDDVAKVKEGIEGAPSPEMMFEELNAAREVFNGTDNDTKEAV